MGIFRTFLRALDPVLILVLPLLMPSLTLPFLIPLCSMWRRVKDTDAVVRIDHNLPVTNLNPRDFPGLLQQIGN